MNDAVIRTGKLFEAGDYPDKGYAMTPEELAAAAAAFQPVPVDLEHTPTVLSGKLGTLESVELADDGATLRGAVAWPKWLDDVLGSEERKVSCTWDRETKRLKGLALVLSPRVTDAALMAAFTRHNDVAAERGSEAAAESGKGNHTMTVEEIKNAIMALFAKGDAPEEKEPATKLAETPAENAEMSALREQLATERRKRLEVEAASFARAEIQAKRALPAEEAALRSAMFQALTDDEAHGQVTFAEGKTGCRADQLRSLCASRPPHVLFDELAGADVPSDAVVLVNRQGAPGGTAEMSEARRKELLSKTPLGQAILNGK